VRKVSGQPGNFRCEVVDGGDRGTPKALLKKTLVTSLIIDAHGSWESGPQFQVVGESGDRLKTPQRGSDLFAFKSTFVNSTLTPGLLPVIALKGGYGGIVVANEGRTTMALCIRRNALQALRLRTPEMTAAIAVETHLRESCRGIEDSLRNAQRQGSWLTVGPLRPGIRLQRTPGIFRVGNASGESHPLIGEGISMALQSSKLLVESLLSHVNPLSNARALSAAHLAYAKAWRESFLPRLRIATLYAHVAMRAPLAASVGGWLRQWPQLLTTGARLAGKAQHVRLSPMLIEGLL
jgi:2-polyprenyl-6-methoxyphenol hydroxylase-like FAD-dependent oxidoreductase